MERHYVTVVFSDISDSTRFAHTEDPETVAAAMSRVRSLANDIATKHRGIVNQHHGDGIMALFGLPRSREDDAVRAIDYALELHGICTAESPSGADGFTIRLHTGVDCGLVAISKGHLTSGVYDAFGDALNRAARLSDIADKDEIVVNLDTLGLAVRYFETGPASLVQLKGIERAVKSATLLGGRSNAAAYSSSIRQELTTFSGRRDEFQSLSEVFQRDKAELTVFALLGEAGIGKSRLASEFLASLPHEVVRLKGSCSSELGDSPLRPLVDCLRKQVPGEHSADSLYPALDAYLESVDASLTGRTPALHAALHSLADCNVQEVSIALRAWLVALARKRRCILYVDDWQWADDAFRALVSGLIIDNPPLMLLLAARDLSPGDPGLTGERVQLGPLSKAEAESAVFQLLGTITEPGLLHDILEQSGGNPLYLEELCQSVRARSSGSALVPELHPTLAGLIQAKVSDLSEEARETAYICAVLGDRIPTQMLIDIAGSTDAVPELSSSDILFASSVSLLRFKHGLTRQVIYSVIPREEARRLHARAAQVLLQEARVQGVEEPVEELARHYTGADEPELSLHYSSLAGGRALVSNTLDRSRHHYLNAIAALRRLPDSSETARAWLDVASRLALACTYAPSHEVIRILHEALARVSGEQSRAQIEYYLGWIHYALGDQNRALQHARTALTVAEKCPGTEKLQAQLHACIGQSAAVSCDYPLAREYLERAISTKQSRGKGKSPPIGWAYATSCLALLEADTGNFDRAYELADEALASIAGINQSIEASVSNNYILMQIWHGQWNEVIDHADGVRVLCERHSLPFIYLVSRMSDSYARWMLDRDENALEILRIATRQVLASEMQLYLSILCGWAADAMSRAGKFDDARDFAARGLASSERGDPVSTALLYCSLHRCWRGSGQTSTDDPDQYLALAYDAARTRGSRREEAVTSLYEAEYLLEAGQAGRAHDLALKALAETGGMGMHWYTEQARVLVELALDKLKGQG